MAIKQPRVPQYRKGEGVEVFMGSLILFLKDFCQEVWTESKQTRKRMDQIRYPVTSVNGKTGEVSLGAQDVGARAADWMPSAGDIGALPSGATAENSMKFAGKTWNEMLLTLYPVGSVYLSASAISPAALFGGTWEALMDRFLLGAGNRYEAETVGGETETVLEIKHIPAHAHDTYGRALYDNGGNHIALCDVQHSDRTYSTGDAGEGEAHNNMPPYLAVYMWKRVN